MRFDLKAVSWRRLVLSLCVASGAIAVTQCKTTEESEADQRTQGATEKVQEPVPARTSEAESDPTAQLVNEPGYDQPLGMDKAFVGPLAGDHPAAEAPAFNLDTAAQACAEQDTGDLGALKCIPVPRPTATDIKDQAVAVALGKALFWDVQVGGDGITACASCHFVAGIDPRLINTLNPGPNDKFESGGVTGPGQIYRLVNIKTDDRAGSQGVVNSTFKQIKPDVNQADDVCQSSPHAVFGNFRLVTGRNSPSSVGAVFYRDLFWDGRANHVFNGNDPFGQTANAVQKFKVCDNCALASQAVGPPNNEVEMACGGRGFNGPNSLAAKMLPRQPLRLQTIAATDSVLKPYAKAGQKGLFCGTNKCTYQQLIDRSFRPNVAGANAINNFSRIWGQAVQAYLTTLIPNDTPFDRFSLGNRNALTSRQRRGLNIFEGKADCEECHAGPEMSDATITYFNDEGPINEAGGDQGFHNIGVRPTKEDLGRAGPGPKGFAFAVNNSPFNRGAMKTPMLRNIAMTAPYFHNGGVATLEGVVDFYARGGDFNNPEKDPHMKPISLSGDDRAALVDFLRNGLTDPRVVKQSAPFDHPSLPFPGGITFLATGAAGGPVKIVDAQGKPVVTPTQPGKPTKPDPDEPGKPNNPGQTPNQNTPHQNTPTQTSDE